MCGGGVSGGGGDTIQTIPVLHGNKILCNALHI